MRAALAAELAKAGPVQANPYAKANPSPPAFQILPPGRVFDFAVGMDDWTFTVQAFVSFTDDEGSQMLLDSMIGDGPLSVKQLLEADRTLGGLVQNLTVRASSPGRMADTAGGGPILLVEFQLTMYAERD